METLPVTRFYIAGLAIRTTNENGQAATDIPQLWNKFFSENIAEAISGRVSNAIYCVYTDYELDHTKPYTTILGCRVDSLDDLPEGFTGKMIEEGDYTLRTVKGNLSEGIVFNEWTEIWNSDIPRAYTSDFEVYGDKAQNPEDATVNIFLALK
jgi:predicted transcriptional regulator YdeE